jgi:3-dehydroquinate synthase
LDRSVKAHVVHVDVDDAAYDVVVGSGVLAEVGDRVKALSRAKRIALVSDTHVADLFGARVGALLVTAGFDVLPLSVAPGEQSKSWQVAGELLEAFAHVGLDRHDLVLALGGGVVGDLAGFAAATYLRGVNYVQVPTTLLAQVDSSVGGKTGVDLSGGKNLVGAFKQPRLVVADTDSLTTLTEAEWASGSAEVAKSAVIGGEAFLEWLEKNTEKLRGRDALVTADTVERCVRFKSGVVSSDEREEGARECLNYGHTLGHAIEKVAGYGVVPHGIAVAEGMRFAARLSVEAGHGSLAFVRRQDRLLDEMGLAAMETSFKPGELLEAMHSDKKARGGHVRFVLADAPGLWRCEPVADAMIAEHLDAWAQSKGGGLG